MLSLALAVSAHLASSVAHADGFVLNGHPAMASIPSLKCTSDCEESAILGDKFVIVKRDAIGSATLEVMYDLKTGRWAEPLVPEAIRASGIYLILDDWFLNDVSVISECRLLCEGTITIGSVKGYYRFGPMVELAITDLSEPDPFHDRVKSAIEEHKAGASAGFDFKANVECTTQPGPDCNIVCNNIVTLVDCSCVVLGDPDLNMVWWS